MVVIGLAGPVEDGDVVVRVEQRVQVLYHVRPPPVVLGWNQHVGYGDVPLLVDERCRSTPGWRIGKRTQEGAVPQQR